MDTTMQIIKSLTKFQERPDILKQCHEKIFEGIHLAEAHCIDNIGKTKDANVTKIAASMKMTRGAISKICKKLLRKKLIDCHKKVENNKELYFYLTDTGKEIYVTHRIYHDKAMQNKLALLKAYTSAEQNVILKFLEDINIMYDKHSKEILK
ncbi:MarR family winged helix-turn-helix transcriptional regulator [Pectinatus haikarae]|uniref:MarR family winged helix-turn-helix transcriptional regulator n=1 Tax=Pectinatus haikarae TaxID=349096 RepID=UPI0018C5E8E7|nr:MarR family transcriptional regulator [Pectinatus haikarae]